MTLPWECGIEPKNNPCLPGAGLVYHQVGGCKKPKQQGHDCRKRRLKVDVHTKSRKKVGRDTDASPHLALVRPRPDADLTLV